MLNLDMLINEYIKEGYCISDQVIDKDEIFLLRDELTKNLHFKKKINQLEN